MCPESRGGGGKSGESPGEKTRSAYLIASLARGLAVLDAFSPEKPELSLGDIAEAADVTPASAVRIGHTLVTAGYMVRNPATKGFRTGPHLISAGLATLASLTVPEIAEPFLLDLRDRSEETVNMALPTESEVVIVFRAPSLTFPPEARYPRATLPYHTSGVGLAILAWLPDDTADRLLARVDGVKRTPRSLTAEQARKQLPAIRRKGFAVNDEGTTLGQRSVASAVRGPDGGPVAAVNISVPAQRISRTDLERRLGPMVGETAAAIAATIPPGLQEPEWAGFAAREGGF